MTAYDEPGDRAVLHSIGNAIRLALTLCNVELCSLAASVSAADASADFLSQSNTKHTYILWQQVSLLNHPLTSVLKVFRSKLSAGVRCDFLNDLSRPVETTSFARGKHCAAVHLSR